MITRKTIRLTINAVILSSFSSLTYAAGLTQVTTTGNDVIATLDAISPLVMLAAIIIAGCLVLFRAAGMAVVFSILAGGVLIAGAPEIVTWIGL